MSAAEIYSALGGASGGTAVVMLVLFITDRIYSRGSYDEMKAQRDEWKRIADLERARAEVVVPAAMVVRDVVTGIQQAARKELE